MRTASTTFFALGRQVTQGEKVSDDDAIIEGREHLFEAVEVVDEQDDESEAEKPKGRTRKAANS